MGNKEELIEKEFDKLIEKMNDTTFWLWVSRWFNEDNLEMFVNDNTKIIKLKEK